jgi:hypothetical protein
MSRFQNELENMPLENNIVQLLNDTFNKENNSKKIGTITIKSICYALYNGGALPVNIAGQNEVIYNGVIYNGQQYLDNYETAIRVWRLFDYTDNKSQDHVLVAIKYDNGSDFEGTEFVKVFEKERVIKIYEEEFNDV